MLAMGIIENSESEWCNPVVLVPMKDGTLRFCIEFRYLNTVSKFDSYPTPRIDDLIKRLGKAKYLTAIDLSSPMSLLFSGPPGDCFNLQSCHLGYMEHQLPFRGLCTRYCSVCQSLRLPIWTTLSFTVAAGGSIWEHLRVIFECLW